MLDEMGDILLLQAVCPGEDCQPPRARRLRHVTIGDPQIGVAHEAVAAGIVVVVAPRL